jgi:hypothetical protein
MVIPSLLLSTRLALATETTTRSASRDPTPPQKWYGAPIIASDVSALSFLVVAGLAYPDEGPGQEVLRDSGFILYFAAGPAVHWLNGQSDRGWASLGLRLCGPIALGVFAAGIAVAIDPQERSASTGFGVGAILGVFTVPALDAAALAWRPLEANEEGAVWVQPRIGRSEVGATLVSAW